MSSVDSGLHASVDSQWRWLPLPYNLWKCLNFFIQLKHEIQRKLHEFFIIFPCLISSEGSCFYKNSLKFHRALSFGGWVGNEDWTRGFTHARQMCHHWAIFRVKHHPLNNCHILSIYIAKFNFQEIILKIPMWCMHAWFYCLDLESWESLRRGPFSSDWESVNNKICVIYLNIEIEVLSIVTPQW